MRPHPSRPGSLPARMIAYAVFSVALDLAFLLSATAAGTRSGAPRLLPAVAPAAPYIGSSACAECHKTEHDSWHRTFHRTMTQVATPESVAGTFDGSRILADGLEYKVLQADGRLWAEMPDPDVMMYVVQGGRKIPPEKIPRATVPVVMATGSHHHQTYWVASPRYPGLLQTLPLVYLVAERRWIPRDEAFLRGPADRDRIITQWNHHCIRCHSTGGVPGLDEATGRLNSSVSELGISCEACHGPGEAHARKQRNLKSLGLDTTSETHDETIVNPSTLDPKRSSQICGQCHGDFITRDEFAMEFAKHGSPYRPGDDLHRTRHYPIHPASRPSAERAAELEKNTRFFNERWWDDGTLLAGGREYTAMLGSECYRRSGLSCVSCHSMHKSDPNTQMKPGLDGPSACTKCHSEPKFTTAPRQHTFHQNSSAGSDCLNCHMPHVSYALFRAIRSHQIGSPSAAQSVRHGTPNACNLCHLDRTIAWTQRWLAEWYHQPVSDLSAEQQKVSAAVLWLLKGNAAQRVVAAWHIGWAPAQEASGGRDWLGPFAIQLLEDPYAPVRYVAGTALRTLPGFHGFEFDFIGSRTELEGRFREATAIWSRRRDVRMAPNPAILIGNDGNFMSPEAATLLKERDNRSVTIQE